MNTGTRIADLRGSRGWSQPKLADLMSVSQSTVAMWESGKRNISNEDLIKLSKLFNVSTDYLLGNTNSKQGSVPEWATDKDKKDLQKFLEDNANSMTYGGEELTHDEKQQLRVAMETIFWKRHKHE
ncbi:helix-turn-helix domain-containing protein [Lentilactobacillus hilgardii]|nr:helix-turn-helix transcriptional regulator [Lentilactobacillus hilgardii]MCV3742973.1 helix-turn-helix domain-containing protein [Lentilactobacillus hilgardii]